MFQLVLTVVAIALTAAVVLASINYLPYWYKSAADTESLLTDTVSRLDFAYSAVVQGAGQAPAVDSNAQDGGLSGGFLSILRFTPGAPVGYEWVYGQKPADGSQWAGLHYFCLKPLAGSQGAHQGVYKGMQRLKSRYSPDQLVLNTSCGATSNVANVSDFPVNAHLTFYVVHLR